MEYIQRLPFILATLAAVVTGLICYEYAMAPKDAYIKMIISMVIFFLVGIYARNTINKILDEVKSKKEKEEAEILEKQKKEREEKKALEDRNEKAGVHTVDYKVGDYDEFEPLKVSEYIKTDGDK
jgi:divalent metal cation (Fe/Co/Zn/Cd) transporter